MTRVISVRVPATWAGIVTGERARAWVTGWLQRPVPLSAFPAPGSVKLNLRLSNEEVAALKRLSGREMSSALRAVLALNLVPAAAPDLKAPEKKSGVGRVLGGIASGLLLLLIIAAGVGPRGGQQP